MTSKAPSEPAPAFSTLRVREAPGPPGRGTGPPYGIGDLSREFGVTLRTLRFYESKGMLEPLRDGTARLYREADRRRLVEILRAKNLGFSLRDIRSLLADPDRQETGTREAGGREAGGRTPGAQARGFLLTRAQVEAQIATLEAQRAELDRAIAELRAHRHRVAGDDTEA